MLAVVILIYHASSVFGFIYADIGFLVVSVFFFLSAYGLMHSLNSKKDYLKTFTSHRLPSLIVPWVVAGFVIGVISTLVFGDIVIELYDRMGTRLFAMPMWFVTELIMFYIIFYVSFKFFNNRLFTLIVVSISCFLMMRFISDYTDSMLFYHSGIGFILGLWWWQYKDIAYKILTKLNPVCILIPALVLTFLFEEDTTIFCVAFIVYFMAFMVLDKSVKSICYMLGIQTILCILFFTNTISDTTSSFYSIETFAILSTIFVVKIIMILPLQTYLQKGGVIAYEMFLLHWTMLMWVSECLDMNVYMMTAVAFVFLIILSIPVHKINVVILNKLTQ